MTCPICKTTPLEVKNGNYYCPKCKIFIGKANPTTIDKLSHEGSSATTPVKKSVDEKPIIDKEGITKTLLKKISITLVIGLIIALPILTFRLVTNYSDIFSLCFITINAKSSQGKTVIMDSLQSLKSYSGAGYKEVCSQINTIIEDTCLAGDPHINPEAIIPATENIGCYVKGTRTAYLSPTQDSSTNAIDERAQALVDIAQASKKFWQNK